MKAAPKQAENVAVGSLMPSSVPATYICCTSLVKVLKFMNIDPKEKLRLLFKHTRAV